ncbi:hypothetical protein [uncultured Alsobacter sp.]|uniref:hypothetical protein n=1 Tax=uncultured Alsobacter sp. TaxID=1748258 RepID=UPI0025F8E031|nr:hypothetical protein [uncultured Alsobacter sp.]
MKVVIWLLAAAVFGLWSLFSWGAHSLIGWAGQTGARNADWLTGHPETVEWLSWGAATFGSLGEGVVVVTWAIGSLVIAAGAVAANALWLRWRNRRGGRPMQWQGRMR